jgi:hypothetical protein
MPTSLVRQTFLWLFLAGLAASALLSILLVVGSVENAFSTRILLSTATLCGCSVLAMACAAYRDRRPVGGTIGVVVAVVAALMLFGVIWLPSFYSAYSRWAAVSLIWAIAIAHGQLLLLPQLEARHRWVQTAVLVAITGLALLFTAAFLHENLNEPWRRVAAVLGILVALGTVAVPVLMWIGRSERAVAAADAAAPLPQHLTLSRQPDGTWLGSDGAIYERRRGAGATPP